MRDRDFERYLEGNNQRLGAVRLLTVTANPDPPQDLPRLKNVLPMRKPITRAQIGHRLGLARFHSRLSLPVAARRAQVQEAFLLGLESGAKVASLEDLERFSIVYGCQPDWLLCNIPEADESHRPEGVTDPQIIRDLQVLRAMVSSVPTWPEPVTS